MGVEEGFNKHKIPCDVFWMDIEHTDDKRYFTWNKEKFGNINKFFKKLDEEHRHVITIIDPHIKADENYEVCKKLLDNDCYIKCHEKEGDKNSQ